MWTRYLLFVMDPLQLMWRRRIPILLSQQPLGLVVTHHPSIYYHAYLDGRTRCQDGTHGRSRCEDWRGSHPSPFLQNPKSSRGNPPHSHVPTMATNEEEMEEARRTLCLVAGSLPPPHAVLDLLSVGVRRSMSSYCLNWSSRLLSSFSMLIMYFWKPVS